MPARANSLNSSSMYFFTPPGEKALDAIFLDGKKDFTTFPNPGCSARCSKTILGPMTDAVGNPYPKWVLFGFQCAEPEYEIHSNRLINQS
jgi:hypothetical protein